MPTYSKRGLELSVNTAGAWTQNLSRVATFADGGFVVVWETSDPSADGSGGAIKAQRFDSAGNKAGGEFLVNSSFASGQGTPAVTSFADGSFAIAWTTDDPLQDGNGRAIKARLFGASGEPMGAEFLVNTTTTGNQTTPSMTTLANGNFVIGWWEAYFGEVHARIFTADGTALGADFRVNTNMEGSQNSIALSALAGGGFVATWRSANTADDGSGESVKGQVFNSSGAKVGGEFLVNTGRFGHQNDPSVAALAGGGFVVAWVTSQADDGSGSAIKGQVFSASGAKLGSEFLVNAAGFSSQEQPAVTALPNGGFMVVWTTADPGQDGDRNAVKAQAFDSAGARVGPELLVNTQTSGNQGYADIATLSDGQVIVTWTDNDAEGNSNWGIKAQILGPGDPPPPPPPPNWAPVITSDGGMATGHRTVSENVLIAAHVTAQDPDGQAVTYSIVGGADAALFTIDAQYGIVSFISRPDFEAPGDSNGNNIYEIVVSASDGALADTQSLSIAVADVDENVAFTSSNNIFRPENYNGAYMVKAVQPQDPSATITYRIIGGADAARFAIDGATGALTLASSPNYEVPTDANGDNRYDVMIEATDGFTTAVDSIMFHIYDVDEAPVITSGGGGATFALSIAENQTAVTTIFATDPENPTPNYAIAGGADAARFAINALTGALSFVAAPDFEAPGDSDGDNIYAVTVSATDGSRSDTQTIFVTVTNQNEPIAFVSGGGGDQVAVTVSEKSGNVLALLAVDPDGTAPHYGIAGGADAALFELDPVTKTLRFKSLPDFETPRDSDGDNVYEVVVGATDGQTFDYQAVSVTVANVYEGVSFASPSAEFAVVENIAQAGSVSASSGDGIALTYAIAGGADAARFTIDPFTGALAFVAVPDFEFPTDSGANNVYDVIVSASDGTSADRQTVAVTVGNVDEPVKILSYGGAATVALDVLEDEFAIGIVQARDDEEPVTYAITGGIDAESFEIDPLTGALSFRQPNAGDFEDPTDFDSDNVHEVVVTASSSTSSATQAFMISITNRNEAPGFYYDSGLTVNEGVQAITTLFGYDRDGDSTTLAIVGGADAAWFVLDPVTNLLSFTQAHDFEAPLSAAGTNVYIVEIEASDGQLTTRRSLEVTIRNVNEAVAITSGGGGDTAAVTVLENGTAVTTITASDVDGDALTYSITGGADWWLFAIDARTGVLRFVQTQNFEDPWDAGKDRVYDVVVSVTDGALTDSQAIAVTVANVVEQVAITSNGGGDSASVTVGENSTAVTNVAASAPGGDRITYAIVGGADAARFTINATTGVLAFVAAPNFEAPADAGADNVYDLVVSATNGDTVDTQAIAVTVGNVDDQMTITSDGGGATAAVSVNENSTFVTTVVGTDPDGAPVTYVILHGGDSGLFTINSTTGVLSFRTAPNFEAPGDSDRDNVYTVRVMASDGHWADDQTIAVTVANVVEPVAITSNGGGDSASIAVAENGTAVTNVAAANPDGGSLTYAIAGGADADRFTINATTGALAFVAAPNFEAPGDAGANNVYDVIVSAGNGSSSDTQVLTVTVGNVNEPVAITSNGGGSTASVARAENGTAVTIVKASDPDGGAVTYAIAGGADASRFTIDASTGALAFIAAPNFEAPADAGGDNVYDVVVSASDGSFTDTQAIAVTVGNVDEAPVITSSGGGASGNVSVAENSLAVVTVAATDPDGATISYSIVGGADAARFTINAQTGALQFVTGPDWELPADSNQDNVYSVVVRASDGQLFDDQALNVIVSNIRDGNTVTGTSGGDAISATSVIIAHRTSNAEDLVFGRDGHDTIFGMAGDDEIYGEGGNDVLVGGLGADKLSGGLGKDQFTYNSVSESTAASQDLITDFSRSQGDKISLSAIDANSLVSGNQAFTFIGTSAFSKVAGQLRYETSGGITTIFGDVNGDGIADLQIQLSGPVPLVASDFIL